MNDKIDESVRREFAHEIVDEPFHFLLLFGFLNVEELCVDGENLALLLSADPCLVSLVHFPNILQTDRLFSFAVPLFDTLQAQFGGTLQVNDGFQRQTFHKSLTKGIINSELGRVEVSLSVHYFPEDVAISHGRTLREKQFTSSTPDCLFPQPTAGVQGVQLESESPTMRVLVEPLQDVVAACVFPLVDWLLDHFGIQ